ncbi:zinc-binding dehydrogenase [Pedobacter sp. NJ-S-72]
MHIDGGMAEYLQVPANLLVHGEGLNYDELALIEPLAIGAHGVRLANIAKGEYVLVVGAGPIGLGIMEFARIAGAKVIAADMNDQRLTFCTNKLKVDFTINVQMEDITVRLKEITNGEMPAVVIDATGNEKAINNGFSYMAHGGRYVLVGLQKGDLVVSHPEFHKREATLMSSRNATREDFEQVKQAMKQGWINPQTYITHRIKFDEVATEFSGLLNPANAVIKAMVEL